MPAVQPSLLVAPDGPAVVNTTQDIPVAGLGLVLRVPAVAPGRVELTLAEVTLEGPPGMTELTAGTSPGLVVTTNLGPLSAGWASEQANDVTWLTADWGARRSLVSLNVTSAAGGDATLLRPKISDGGVWFPPLPVDTVSLGTEQPLPDVVASRLMLEAGKLEAGNFKSAKARLKGLTVKLAGQPSDLSVLVGGQSVFSRPGRLLPGQQVRVVDGLLGALQQRIPADGKAVDVPILIQAGLLGPVKVVGAQFTADVVYTALDGGQASLPIAWRGEAVGRLTVGAGNSLAKMSFTVTPELIPERILVEGQAANVSTYAQLCDPGHQAAQGFPGLGETALAGVDVLLRPTTKQVVGTLALHPDVKGRPAEVPYGGALVPFTASVADSALRKPLWVPVQLPKPLLLKERWWAVLTISQGEALWPLSTAVPPLEGSLGPVLRRLGQGAWFPWEPPPSPTWALGRLRVTSQAPAPPFQVELRRGAAKQTVAADASGRVVVPEATLKALGTAGATVEVAVRSASAPVAGAVRVGELRVAVR
ncbi:hypothetical protein [Hyalangium gracile]|uniref:hypothetical protein n=1 Tax=Hyalangium gracile TaxID=394092 RepID=UPI001CCA7DE4|nr:hypothetical protein [Hyalangium gracile]